MTLRTPLKQARNHGSAKEGATHFWQQRMTAVANVLLIPFLVLIVVGLAGADYATARTALSQPWIALPLFLLVVSGAIHMRLGMQVIIEDYIHAEGLKLALLLLNTFFAVAVAAAAALAILKLSFGG